MLNGLVSVIVVFLIMAVGFYFTKTSRWPESTNSVFSITVVNIAAPALAVVSIENRFTPELLKSSAVNLLVIYASFFILYFGGKLLAKLLKLSKEKAAVFTVTFVFNNSMFIGLPIISIVFGKDGLPYLFTYYLVSISLFWSIGVTTLEKASSKGSKGISIKKIFSPGLIGVLIGCFLAGFGLHLPLLLETALSYLGDICVPLSLLVIGANLAKSLDKGLPRITLDQVIIMLCKFLICPALTFGMFTLLGPSLLGIVSFTIADLPLKVFILTAAMPCHAQTAIMAEYYDLEAEYASNLVSLSVLLSLATIPIYAGFLL